MWVFLADRFGRNRTSGSVSATTIRRVGDPLERCVQPPCQGPPNAMASSEAPPQEGPPPPLARVLAALDQIVCGPCPSGRRRELRDHAAREATIQLTAPPPESSPDDAEARGMAYAFAVGAYYDATAPRYPVDPRAVAGNVHLSPGPPRPGPAVGGEVLVDPAGAIYADPLSLIRAAGSPSLLLQLILAPCGRLLSVAEAEAAARRSVSLSRAAFCIPPGAFPYAGAVLEGGELLLHAGPHPVTGAPTWVRGGAVPLLPGPSPAGDAGDAPGSQHPEGPAPSSSALRGARGEALVAEALEQAGYQVRSVAHRPRSADMVVAAGGGEIYIEAKDYSAAVPDKEVKKFLRDLGARGAAGGVLVSLSSGITGVRGGLSARVEALPGEGRLAPVVYVSRGGVAVAAAGVARAAPLSRHHPAPLDADALSASLGGGYDRLEPFAAELDQLGALYEATRADLARLSTALAGGCGNAIEQMGFALRDHRRLARALRAAAESPQVEEREPPEVWAEVLRRYPVPDGARETAAALVTRLGGAPLGDLRPLARWRFLKTKATHLDSEIALSFSRGRAEVCVPLAVCGDPPARAARLLGLYPKKVRIGDGHLALELDGETGEEALALW